jgi:hypothetical protein
MLLRIGFRNGFWFFLNLWMLLPLRFVPAYVPGNRNCRTDEGNDAQHENYVKHTHGQP